MTNLFFTATRYNPQHVLHQLLSPPETLVITSVCMDTDLLYQTYYPVTCEKNFRTIFYTVTFIKMCYVSLVCLYIAGLVYCVPDGLHRKAEKGTNFILCASVIILDRNW